MSPEIGRTQLHFDINLREVRLVTPESLPSFIDEIVGNRKLWWNRTIKSKDGVYIDLDTETAQIFDTYNWQVKGKFGQLKDLKIRRDKVALIMQIGDFTKDKLEIIERNLEEVFDVLIHSSPVFILEKRERLTQGESNIRKNLLKEIGYVEVNTLRLLGEGLVLWEGRMEKRRPPRKPVDMLNSRNGIWLEKVYMTQIKAYRDIGFLLKGKKEDQPIWKELGATKMPPRAISSLKNGFGMTLISTKCGICEWEIGLEGEVTRKNSCDDENCQNISPKQKRVITKPIEHNTYNLVGTVILETTRCGSCSSPLHVVCRLIRDVNKTTSIIHEETYCADCGKMRQIKRLKVHPGQILGREQIRF